MCGQVLATMQSFLHAVRQNSHTENAGEGPASKLWSDMPSGTYSCLAPMSTKASQQVSAALAHLTGVHMFPGAHPTMLTSEDLWKLTQHPYKVAIRPSGLRMLLCFLTIEGRTTAALVSENMMIVRAQMNRVPFSMFRGSCFDGFVVIGEDGSVSFQVLDCLAYKGPDAAMNFHDSRYDKCAELVQAYQLGGGQGFELELVAVHDANSRGFYETLEMIDRWHSLLYIPVTRGIKKASAQSTLFQIGSIGIAEVKEALTEAILGNVVQDADSRLESEWAIASLVTQIIDTSDGQEAEAEGEGGTQAAPGTGGSQGEAAPSPWTQTGASIAVLLSEPSKSMPCPVKPKTPLVPTTNAKPFIKNYRKSGKRYGSFAPVPLQPAFCVPVSLQKPAPDADGFVQILRRKDRTSNEPPSQVQESQEQQTDAADE